MKPKPRTIQYLLPTASPGEIELVYRELLGVIGNERPLDGTIYSSRKLRAMNGLEGWNEHVKSDHQKLANLFGKEG